MDAPIGLEGPHMRASLDATQGDLTIQNIGAVGGNFVTYFTRDSVDPGDQIWWNPATNSWQNTDPNPV
jgi:hypothetical protein